MNKPTPAAFYGCAEYLADAENDIIRAAADLPATSAWMLDDLLAKVAEARIDVVREHKAAVAREAIDSTGPRMHFEGEAK